MAGTELDAVIVHETEASCRDRLVASGFAWEIAAEIAAYLAQSTDLADFRGELEEAFVAARSRIDFVELDAFAAEPARHLDGGRRLVWSMTDGFAYFRGSAIAAAIRLAGGRFYGSSVQAQHLCQDKFKTTVLAASAGLRVPPTLLCRGNHVIGAHGSMPKGLPLFVKPNRLGAKIGIFADSLCPDLSSALAVAERLAARYRDDAVIQTFVPGSDIRVSYMDLGQAMAPALGIARLLKDPAGETGGAFLTMRDNASLSGSRDTEGGITGFGRGQSIAFIPKLVDLRREAFSDPSAAAIVAELEAMTTRAVQIFDLRDYFSLDFRVGDDGTPYFLEFEVCPAVTIYDFQSYLKATYGIPLGEALRRSMRRAAAIRRDPSLD